jgi:hypothetical protein
MWYKIAMTWPLIMLKIQVFGGSCLSERGYFLGPRCCWAGRQRDSLWRDFRSASTLSRADCVWVLLLAAGALEFSKPVVVAYVQRALSRLRFLRGFA